MMLQRSVMLGKRLSPLLSSLRNYTCCFLTLFYSLLFPLEYSSPPLTSPPLTHNDYKFFTKNEVSDNGRQFVLFLFPPLCFPFPFLKTMVVHVTLFISSHKSSKGTFTVWVKDHELSMLYWLTHCFVLFVNTRRRVTKHRFFVFSFSAPTAIFFSKKQRQWIKRTPI